MLVPLRKVTGEEMTRKATHPDAMIAPSTTYRPRRWSRIRGALEQHTFVIPAVVMLIALLIYPLLYTLQLSFSSFDSARFAVGDFVGLRNYRSILNNASFWKSLQVTVIYLAAALPLQMVLGTGIALILAVDWPGARIVRALFIIPMVITLVVAGTVFKMLLDPLWGYFNYVWGLFGGAPVSWFSDPVLAMVAVVMIDTWRWTPFVTLIVLAGVVSLDKEPFEAAAVDGASHLQRLIHVTLPMLSPVIMSALVVRWLGAIKMFDIILTATEGGPGSATEVVNLFIYQMTFRRLAFDRASAAIVLVGLVSVVLTFVIMRIGASKEK